MGLVDGDQADVQRLKEPLETREGQALRSDVQYLDLALAGLVLDLVGLLGRQGAVQQPGGDAVGPETVHLVFHQGDEGRDHQGEPLEAQGRELVAQRLAAAGGHQHQGVALGEHFGDDLFLEGQEPVETEICL